MTQAGQAFPKTCRLLSRSDFIRLSSSRNVFSSKLFLLVWSPNTFDHARLGVTASRKYGNAVQRNRFKRIVRESFRQIRSLLPAVDLNVIARRNASTAESEVIRHELRSAFIKLGG